MWTFICKFCVLFLTDALLFLADIDSEKWYIYHSFETETIPINIDTILSL